MGRKFKRKDIIEKLYLEQKGRCAYCFNKMALDLGRGDTATVDHIVPKSKGGPNEEFNLVAACHTCNNKKADMLPAVFIKKRAVVRDGPVVV